MCRVDLPRKHADLVCAEGSEMVYARRNDYAGRHMMELLTTEEVLASLGQQHQATLAVLLYDNLRETLSDALLMLGGGNAPEYEGITYVIGALSEAIDEIMESLGDSE